MTSYSSPLSLRLAKTSNDKGPYREFKTNPSIASSIRKEPIGINHTEYKPSTYRVHHKEIEGLECIEPTLVVTCQWRRLEDVSSLGDGIIFRGLPSRGTFQFFTKPTWKMDKRGKAY
ncbi:hypothetical protein M8J77_011208 [Diaphorina citri]|nr:hypothetical protein M8J77_011208 [Diaphorina citri]